MFPYLQSQRFHPPCFDEDSENVSSSHVKRAKDKIEHNKVTEIISTLPIQQQRVLEAILNLTKENGEITSGKFLTPRSCSFSR